MLSFEEDPSLPELLSIEQQQRLCRLLGELGGGSLQISEKPEADAEPVELNLETLGWLHGDLSSERRQAAARLLETILVHIVKYRLAANLHHDTTEASYAELQSRNRALQASRARYKALSEQLQERVEAQVKLVEQAQRQLYESARLRAIGQLAAGVAHEINNPLGFISSNLRVAAEYLTELDNKLQGNEAAVELLEDFRALLQESLDGSQRIANIVADLKTFSNIDQADFVPCDLNALLISTCHLLQAETPRAQVIQLDLGELPALAGFPAKLTQAFYNLLDNALKALGEHGHIRVTSRSTRQTVEITIEDDGCGIAEENLGRVFDPFFTTRDVGAGTGLGLCVARDTLAAHQADIQLDSQVGRGTRAILRFALN
ncbi:sensor histidine kinase [Pseudomonas zhanjiangensis]|uniref:histidine kinase n=1 Tax=Pseudomonas zhanjiangensis TaxID=3239015 RepID=A0ABV3YZH2_9PSED